MIYKIGQTQITKANAPSNLFANKKIIKVGVQGPMGFQFWFNQEYYNYRTITLGAYGIYELDLEGLGYLDYFSWNRNSLSDNDIVYVDYVYLEFPEGASSI